MSAIPLFNRQPEFITNDPRNDPNHDVGWTGAFQEARYAAWLGNTDLAGKTVLDLGCAGAAVGAYCIDGGAAHYTGVEISDEICSMARANLSRYHATGWTIVKETAEVFTASSDQRYDVAIAAGVMHGISNFLPFMQALANSSNVVIFESFHPNMTVIPGLLNRLAWLAPSDAEKAEIAKAMAWIETEQPYIEINPNGMMCMDDNHASASNILKFGLSMGALKVIMDRFGFSASYEPYKLLCKSHPRYFGRGRRFAMRFTKTHDPIPMSFAELRESGMLVSKPWSMMATDKMGA